MLDTFPNNQTSDTRRQSPRLGWEGHNLTFTKIVPAAPPVARFGEVRVFFENRPYMDHGKAIRVENGGVPEAPEFFENGTKLVSFSKKFGHFRANPAWRAAAAVLESTGPSFKENRNGQNPLGFG